MALEGPGGAQPTRAQPPKRAADADMGDEAEEGIQQRRQERRQARMQPAQRHEGPLLMDAAIRYMLSLGMSVKTLQWTTIDSYKVPKESAIVEGMKRHGRAYHQTCADAARGHTLGPPGIYIVQGLAQGMQEMLKAVAQQTAALDEWLRRFNKLDTDDAVMCVPQTALRPMHDQTKQRLELTVRDIAARVMFRNALLKLGILRLLGTAPRGALEDNLQKSLIGGRSERRARTPLRGGGTTMVSPIAAGRA